jgi:hypothetical protein
MASKRNKQNKRKTMKKGGFPGVSARYYYPQNMLAQDPQRDMTTSQMKGGCGCGMKTGGGGAYGRTGRKNHSRKYLKKNRLNVKGGAGFFNNFGTITGANTAAGQVTGAQVEPISMKPAYLV